MFDQYYVSKLSFRENANLIDSVYVYPDEDGCLGEGGEHNRTWLVNRIKNCDFVNCVVKNNEGQWIKSKRFLYKDGLFQWNVSLPKNIASRNVFISFYHRDESYKVRLEKILEDLSINQSVRKGDINSNNGDEYIRHLIQGGFLKDTTVLIVLVGPYTKNRKHVDWEISGALDYKVGDRYAGILALHLPEHPDYGKSSYNSSEIPKRLLANLKTGYAKIYDWTTDRSLLQKYIENAFARRENDYLIVNREIKLKTRDDPDI